MRARLILLPLVLAAAVFLLWQQTTGAGAPPTSVEGTEPSELPAPDTGAPAAESLALDGPSAQVESTPTLRSPLSEAPGEFAAASSPSVEHPIQGQVLGPQGAPVPGAEIWITQGNSTRLEFADTTARTDPDGRFSLPEQRMRVFGLLALAEGRGGALGGTYTLRSKKSIELELRFQDAPSVSGQVVWADGSPAADAVVDAFGTLHVRQFHEPDSEVRDNVSGYARIGTSTSADDGSFQLTGLISKALRLRATAEAEDGSTWLAIAQPVASGQTQVRLQLQALSTVEVAVVDDRGLPVTEVRLRSTPLLGDFLGTAEPELLRHKLASPDGIYRAEGYFTGSWRIEVYATDHWPQAAAPWPTVSVPTTERIPVTIWRSGAARGLALGADGQTLPDIPVRLWSSRFHASRAWKKTSTDAEGRYHFPSLQPGTNYTVHAGIRGIGPELDFTLRPGRELELPPLLLDPGGDLLVQLLDAEGRPWPDRPVVTLGGGQANAKRRSDAEGQVRFEQLVPGEFLVVASGKEEVAVTGSPEDAELARATVEIRMGQTTEVVLQERPLDNTKIAGRLRVNGTPMPGHRLFFYSDGAMVFEGASEAKTNDEGRFRTTLPRPGRYRWMASTPGQGGPSGGSGIVLIPPGGVTDLELQGSTGSLEILAEGDAASASEWLVFAGPTTPALPGIPSRKSMRPAVSAGAGWSIEGLAPGPYLLRAVSPKSKSLVACREALVEGGRSTRVTLAPMSFAPVELDLSGVVSNLDDSVAFVELAVWGEDSELLASVPLTYSSNPVQVELPQGARFLAIAVIDKVAICSLDPAPWEGPLRLQARPAGFLYIDQDPAALHQGSPPAQLIDSNGRNWARVPFGPTVGMSWLNKQIIHGRWASPPLPPGSYTLSLDGRSRTVEVRAGERTLIHR